MTGELFVNGKDAWDIWGVSMCVGCLETLLTPVPLYGGIGSESTPRSEKELFPKYGERDLFLDIRIDGETREEYLQNYADFTSELQKGLLVFHAPAIKSTYKLIYNRAPKFISNVGETFSEATFRFNEPDTSDRG